MSFDITTSRDGLSYFGGVLRHNNPNAPNATNNAIVFYVRVLTEPINVGTDYIQALVRDNFVQPPFKVGPNGRLVPDPTFLLRFE